MCLKIVTRLLLRDRVCVSTRKCHFQRDAPSSAAIRSLALRHRVLDDRNRSGEIDEQWHISRRLSFSLLTCDFEFPANTVTEISAASFIHLSVGSRPSRRAVRRAREARACRVPSRTSDLSTLLATQDRIDDLMTEKFGTSRRRPRAPNRRAAYCAQILKLPTRRVWRSISE